MSDDPIRLVVDANIFISAFLKVATSRHLLLDERLELYAPADLFREAQKVLRNRLANRIKAIPDFDQLFSTLTSGIHVVDKNDYDSFMSKALEIAPHQEDAPYLACALHLGIPLWSNDAELRDQNFVKVLSTTALLEKLKNRRRRSVKSPPITLIPYGATNDRRGTSLFGSLLLAEPG